MEKPNLLDAAGNPIGLPKPVAPILDARGEWLDGDNKGDLVLKRTQEVPQSFWDENQRLRELSRINGPMAHQSAIRMPEIVEEALYRKYPQVTQANWGEKKTLLRIREMIRLLKLMGEDRCITTVWSI